MERTSGASALLTKVEIALLGGRNLEQIETELLSGSNVDEDEQAAVWLYAWSREWSCSRAPAVSSRPRRYSS
jgi:hypothetical protein